MADFNLGQRGSRPVLMGYQGKEPVDEILQWAWDNCHLGSSALVKSVKDENEAENLRSLGNQFYKAKEYVQALKMYNLSILAAPHPVLKNETLEASEDDHEFAFPRIDPARYGGVAIEQCSTLGKAFANRSAVMLDLKEYEKCLQDIDLAIEYGYPSELHPKLEERRSKCNAAQLQGSTSDSWQRDFATEDLSVSMGRFALKEILSRKVTECSTLNDPNPSIPAVSSAVKVSYWPNKGRGLVATRDIKPGEILGVERAFACGLSKDELLTQCSTCHLHCLNPLPCPGCSQVIFCSKSCRARGLAEDHWLECKVLPSLLAHGMYAFSASYKMLKTFTFQQMKSIRQKLMKDKSAHGERLGFDNQGKYSSSSFQSVYHLHQSLEAYSFEGMIPECLAAIRMTKFLELSERYFVDDVGKPVPVTKDDFLEASKMLMINYYKSNENSFKFEDVVANIFEKVTTFHLFPTLSLINHSCFPVTSVARRGNKLVWHALKPVVAGEELTISYVGDFSDTAKSERREKLLKHMFFVCHCQACDENWPTSPHLPELKVLCKNCNKPHSNACFYCSNCMEDMHGNLDANQIYELRYTSQKFASALDILREVSLKEPSKQEFKRICEAADVAFKYSVMPSLILVQFLGLVKRFGDECV